MIKRYKIKQNIKTREWKVMCTYINIELFWDRLRIRMWKTWSIHPTKEEAAETMKFAEDVNWKTNS